MFGLGTSELIIILIIALIIFGAGKLPAIGASLGQAIKNFKKTLTESEVVIPQKEETKSISTKSEGG
ncbi:MAG: twin-arginine translocase TatA/TatE family subunit [Nitrospirota bacterium]